MHADSEAGFRRSISKSVSWHQFGFDESEISEGDGNPSAQDHQDKIHLDSQTKKAIHPHQRILSTAVSSDDDTVLATPSSLMYADFEVGHHHPSLSKLLQSWNPFITQTIQLRM